jgi:hypothetical protein
MYIRLIRVTREYDSNNIIPKIVRCPKHLVERGATVYIWQLGRNGEAKEVPPETFKLGAIILVTIISFCQVRMGQG